MLKKILWLDNDPSYINVYIKFLRSKPQDYEVVVVSTVTQAEDQIKEARYDLLILDVMIPTANQEEEIAYPPNQTDHGLKMGLSFYKNHQKELSDSKTEVLVLTARIDETIKQSFLDAGIPTEFIVEKAEVAEVSDFLEKVKEILSQK